MSGEFPPGEFSHEILDGLWPLTPPGHASEHQAKRQSDAATHRDHASTQRTIRTGHLAPEKGKTAETLMKSHNEAEVVHHRVADGHEAKSRGYGTADDVFQVLRSQLSHIAAVADSNIKQIRKSKAPEALKITKIAEEVARARAEATEKSVSATASMSEGAQQILTDTGQGKSVSDLAKALDNNSSKGPGIGNSVQQTGWSRPGVAEDSAHGNNAGGAGGWGRPDANQANSADSAIKSGGESGGWFRPANAEHIATASTGVSPGSGLGSAVPKVSAPSGGQGLASAAQSLSPNSLAKGFSSGLSSGLPASAESHAASSAITNAATSGSAGSAGHAGAPPVSQNALSAASSAPVVSAPIAQQVQQASSVGAVEHASAAPQAAPIVAPVQQQAAPVAPVAPTVSAQPQGPLPAYGSDLRTAVPSTPAAPAAQTFPTSGAAAPVTGTGTGSGLGQPAVVRQAPPPVPPGQVNAAITAGTSTTAGAVVGAVAETVEEQRRCDEWLNAVAVQEPRIHWAAGARVDGSILIVTDLAGGWVPPHVRVPAGAKIIQPDAAQWPARRSAREMLGANVFDSTYSPGQPTGPALGVDLSDWPRQVDPVEDIGWALRKAADWRDGLPRLAHTMAKAWALRTGVRDIEITALRDHLASVRADVLASYPDRVGPHAVGNWMLLAAIDAFCADQFMLGNYHFRWFQTVHQLVGAE
ncbi:putative transmembrane protein [Mycobacteroides abscessus subsp. abscessus]|nr:putative transmembrane protein [Mycobacteroides abscessus subsp. abscessus]